MQWKVKEKNIWWRGFALIPVIAKAGPGEEIWVWLEPIGIRLAIESHPYPGSVHVYCCTWAYRKAGQP